MCAAEPVFDYDVRSTLSSLVAKEGVISDGRKGGVSTPPPSWQPPYPYSSPPSERGRGCARMVGRAGFQPRRQVGNPLTLTPLPLPKGGEGVRRTGEGDLSEKRPHAD